MEELSKAFGAVLLSVGGVFILIIIGTLMGGVAGWTVGLVFVDIMAELKSALGLDVTNFELGAMLGFVGGFFRGKMSSN